MNKYININNYNLKVINKNTKEAERIIDSFNNATLYNLWQCYERPSCLKVSIFEDCKAMASKFNSFDYKILSYNTMQFTFAFSCEIDDKKYLIYRTKAYDKIMEIE